MVLAVILAIVYIYISIHLLNRIINKKNTFIITFYVIFFVCSFSYAKYILTRCFDVEITTMPFYFEVEAENSKIELIDNQAEINLTIKNNDGMNYNLYNTIYEINLVDNEKFEYTINDENTNNKTINGNDLINETLKIKLKQKEGISLGAVEYVEVKITSLEPYKKEIDIPIEILQINYNWEYSYVGDYQTFTVPIDGNYKIELWGAQGGPEERADMLKGGYGAYTSGEIMLTKGKKLYVYVGNKGYMPDNTIKPFNGGGAPDTTGTWEASYPGNYSGGGATDVRLTSGTWDNFDSLKSRIMVAAGGSGGNNIDGTTGGAGGGLLGLTNSNKELVAVPTQTLGFSFGIGQESGVYPTQYVASDGNTYIIGADTGAGGGGYYGGYRGYCHNSGGSSGSSFISGHNGCDAISSSSTSKNIIHTGQSVHYSGYQFNNTIMIDGDGYYWTTSRRDYIAMPSHDGNTNMVGNAGNGYAKITFLGQ